MECELNYLLLFLLWLSLTYNVTSGVFDLGGIYLCMEGGDDVDCKEEKVVIGIGKDLKT